MFKLSTVLVLVALLATSNASYDSNSRSYHENIKFCPACNVFHHLSEFGKRGSDPHGYRICKIQAALRSKKSRRHTKRLNEAYKAFFFEHSWRFFEHGMRD